MQYSDTVLSHFMDPRNIGEMPKADGVGTMGDSTCSDVLTIYLKIKNKTVTYARFEAFGCAGTVAAGSVTTTLLPGMTLDDCRRLTAIDIERALGGLPEELHHCAQTAQQAVQEAVDDYLKKKK